VLRPPGRIRVSQEEIEERQARWHRAPTLGEDRALGMRPCRRSILAQQGQPGLQSGGDADRLGIVGPRRERGDRLLEFGASGVAELHRRLGKPPHERRAAGTVRELERQWNGLLRPLTRKAADASRS
jgi:hypothetical protein